MYKFHNWRTLHPTASGGGGPESAQGAGDDGAESTNDGDENGDSDDADDDDGSENPKDVTMTQEKLDALIDKAYKRGLRKGAKDSRGQAAESPADDGQGDGDDGKAAREAEARATEKLAEANAKLLAAAVKSMGADMEISAKGLKVAERLVDMDECTDANGDIDEDAVEDWLEEFVKEYPELKTGGGKKPGVKQFEGNPSGGAGKLTREDFQKMSFKERLKLKEENPKLYDLMTK
ncbi:hypothetical protein LJB76_02515 [Clostridia bacterium OttesenSCG-928-O13]|nr:hypothetical protein [Clostridia bacterium OttesenSCG-928-O13]